LRSGLVDGVIIYSTEPLPAWYVVRGYEHPHNAVVAQPYRAPDCRPPPPVPPRSIPCLATVYWAVERDSVAARLWPEDSWKTLAVPQLDEMLDSIGAWWRGLTGSRAIACEAPDSDYDILALVSDPAKALSALERMRREGLIRQCKHRHLLKKREPRHARDAALHPRLVEESLTDSCYRGVPYTLRILRSPVELECGRPRAWLGRVRVEALLAGGPESILVPARYPAETSLGPLTVETWRTRYQGLPTGTYLVQGDLYLERGEFVLTPDHGGYIALSE